MADQQPAVDAIDSIVGVATGDQDSTVLAPRALNMDFRNGIKPRSGLASMTLIFENAARDKEHFNNANVQCVHKYQSNSFRPSGIMFLIGGIIYFGAISGRFLYIKRIYTAMSPDVTHGWMVQGFNYLICQDGVSKAAIWDGYSDFARQSNPDIGQIPTGGAMEFIHNRIVVCSVDNQDKIAVSDLWTSSRTDAITFFIEGTVWANAGVFGLMAQYGHIVGLSVVSRQKLTPSGQGELLVLASNGGQTLNLQGLRETWIDSPIVDTASIGGGGAAVHGFLNHNAKLWYVAHDGIRVWNPVGSDSTTGNRDTLISGDIDYYWRQSDANNRNCLCAGGHDSKLFFGLYPVIESTAHWGRRKYCGAWVTLDTMFRSRNGQQLPLSWDGLQTGIRPIQYVTGLRVRDVNRSYVMSHDTDGVNRVYEITNFLRDDVVDGTARKVMWSVDYPLLGNDKRGGGYLRPRKPTNLRVDYTNADGEVQIEAQYRSRDSFCLEKWGTIKACGYGMEDCLTRQMHRGRQNFVTPPPPTSCDVTSGQYRVRLNGTGSVEISNLIGALQPVPTGEIFMRSEAACGSCGDAPRSKAMLCSEVQSLYSIIDQPATC